MLNVQSFHIKGYKEFEVPYTLIKNNEKTKKLAILLPGAGYTVQKPLFHYTTGIYLQSNFDVLQINYQYHLEHFEANSKEELIKALLYDVNKVIDLVLKDYEYNEFHIISKSIGTIALSNIASKEEFKSAKLIWLTPLLKNDYVYFAMKHCTQQSLGLIGDDDPNYDHNRFNELINNKHIVTKLIPGTNHSLELSVNIIGSIDILKDIMTEITAFTNHSYSKVKTN